MNATERQVVGRLLAEVGKARLEGRHAYADELDLLALEIEHPELRAASEGTIPLLTGRSEKPTEAAR